MSHLVLITLGPVQDFIQSARRSRDLWFGSTLLSEVSKATAKAITDFEGESLESLIFPAPVKEDLEPRDPNPAAPVLSVANIILARVNGDPADILKAARIAADKRLVTLATQAFDSVTGTDFNRNLALQQVKNLLEWFTATVPIKDDNSDYIPQRARLYAILAARKSTRDFTAVTWGAHTPKSSLDGQREGVIAEEVYDQRRSNPLDELELYRRYGVRRGERLCGVGLMKRHGGGQAGKGFSSTSHMAAMPLLKRASEVTDQNALRAAWRDLLNTIESSEDLNPLLTQIFLPQGMAAYSRNVLMRETEPDGLQEQTFYDARILYRDRASEFAEDKKKARENLAKNLDPFLEACYPGERWRDPNPYYVLLHGDGDRMGAALSEKKEPGTHQQFSRDLSKFAERAREIVPKAGGSLVYAGGDDVMAFLPLHTALGCAKKLADAFKDGLKDHSSPEGPPTLSVGLVIAHHLEPLSDVLGWARDAESLAKKTYGRNALAVTLAKRGGVNITVGDHWEHIVRRLQLFTDMHRLETIPDGAAYQLREIARDLAHIPDAAEFEAQRVLGRKRSKNGLFLSKETIDNLQSEIDHGLKHPHIGLEGIANEIIIARLLAEVADQANLAAPEREQQPDQTNQEAA